MSERLQQVKLIPESKPIQWADVPEKVDNYFEYCWAGTPEQVEAFLKENPSFAVARIWRGVIVEGYPEATIFRFRSTEAVRQPEWASRMDTQVAAATVGVFAGT